MSKQNERYLAALKAKSDKAKPLITITRFLRDVERITHTPKAKGGRSVHAMQMGCGAGQSLKYIVATRAFSTQQNNVLLLLAEMGYVLAKKQSVKRSKTKKRHGKSC